MAQRDVLSAGAQALREGALLDAASAFESVLRVDPECAPAHHGLGLVLARAGHTEAAAKHVGAAHLAAPDDLEIHRNLGLLLVQAHRLDRGVERLRAYLALRPDDPVARRHLVRALIRMSRHEEAADLLDGLELNNADDLADAWEAWAGVCAWSTGIEDRLRQMTREALALGKPAPLTPFRAVMIGARPETIRDLARSMSPAPRSRARSRRSPGPLRIGYLSGDLHDHPVGLLLAPILEAHASELDVRAFALQDANDSVRARIERAVPVLSLPTDDESAIECLAAAELDVLVDLAGPTGSARPQLLAARTAHAQAHLLGFPGSVPLVDYQLLHRSRLGPGGEADYDEAIVLLPETFVAAEGFAELEAPSRAELGLPDDVFVFGFFGAPYRITPELYDGWMLLLRSLPSTVLWIQASSDRQRLNLRAEAERRGVDPARILFAEAGKLSALGHHSRCDLWLDGWRVSSGTASIIAVWSGTPLLTLAGAHPAGRTGVGVLSAAGLDALVAPTKEAYLQTAMTLAESPRRLAEIRGKLRGARQSPLFDVPRFTRHLERAYAEMSRRAESGLAPASFEV